MKENKKSQQGAVLLLQKTCSAAERCLSEHEISAPEQKQTSKCHQRGLVTYPGKVWLWRRFETRTAYWADQQKSLPIQSQSENTGRGGCFFRYMDTKAIMGNMKKWGDAPKQRNKRNLQKQIQINRSVSVTNRECTVAIMLRKSMHGQNENSNREFENTEKELN